VHVFIFACWADVKLDPIAGCLWGCWGERTSRRCAYTHIILILLILIADIKRHRQDKLINTRSALVYRQDHGDFVATTWAEVKSGDVLMINNGDMLPCDLLLLSSARQDGRYGSPLCLSYLLTTFFVFHQVLP
jgi:hypothetical protein